jgi:DNA (cytosine-5)-methyltransferase 1
VTPRIVDLFAGPGGWDQGLRLAGHRRVLGLEIDRDACNTAEANGHARRRGDVYGIDPRQYAATDTNPVDLVASPPCGGLSGAGRGEGRSDLDQVLEALSEEFNDGEDRRAEHLMTMRDHRSILLVEPMRWLLATRARSLMLEEVPEALPVWAAYAEYLALMGWSVDYGVVDAANYGVPQNRKRAVLAAHRDRAVALPAPTHAKNGGGGLAPWVSMGQALGWDGVVGFPRRADRAGGPATIELDGVLYRARDLFDAEGPAQTLTEKARSWVYRASNQANSARRTLDQPAPTVLFGARTNNVHWMPEDQAGDRFARGIPVTPDEAGQLQSFPAGYVWTGTRSDQFQQIGNAVPPLLAKAIALAVLGEGDGRE